MAFFHGGKRKARKGRPLLAEPLPGTLSVTFSPIQETPIVIDRERGSRAHVSEGCLILHSGSVSSPWDSSNALSPLNSRFVPTANIL